MHLQSLHIRVNRDVFKRNNGKANKVFGEVCSDNDVGDKIDFGEVKVKEAALQFQRRLLESRIENDDIYILPRGPRSSTG